jgi:hypothetical protein
LSSKPVVRCDVGTQYDAGQLIKRQLTSKTASKHQQITTTHDATGTNDKGTICAVF